MLAQVNPQEYHAVEQPRAVVQEPAGLPISAVPSAESSLATAGRQALVLGVVSAIAFLALLGIMFAIMDAAVVVAAPVMVAVSLLVAAGGAVTLRR